ncbi:MAG TPA: hypothetical protein VMB47_00345 [Candidatus Aquilonibacter sp.]|nr:hypothetical protein [Candidatus Aquilonibacter sp.]
MSKKTAIALGVVILLAAAGLAGGWLAKARASKAPSGVWNAQAINGSFAGIRVQESDSSDASVMFLFDLDNRSGADYSLAGGDSNLIVMGRLKSTGSLSPEHQYHLASNVFLPAGNRTRVTLEATEPFHWPAQMDASAEAQFRDMVNRSVADLGGFVVFDPATHYQIELPGSWPAVSSAASVLQN